MRHLALIFIFLFFTDGSSYAQSDSIFIESGGVIVKRYSLAEIDEITFDVTVGVKDEQGKNLPTEFFLSQNFPNPFNPSTKIQCYIPSAGKVKVRIFDINGRLVEEIFSGEKDQGEYTFSWDGTSSTQVASGVYLFSVQFNNSKLTKKIIYLK
ncbi:MAG: T9SS type A sorting domain-containing protein [Bacteroidetes bacterium]|nr:T9SS type A sorting domain-containing protein [Bacteroidota bacterium]